MTIRRLLVLALAVCVGAGAASAQESPFGVAFDAYSEGSSGTLNIKLSVPAGHYLYRHMMDVFLVDTLSLNLDGVDYPRGKIKFDPFEERKLEIYEHDAVIGIRVSSKDGGALPDSGRAFVLFQGCTSEFCYFPEEHRLAAPWTDGPAPEPSSLGVVAAEDGPAPKAAPASPGGAGSSAFDVAEQIRTKGLFLTYLIIFVSGILLSFTPCVFPMIPITLSVIGARGEKNPVKGFLISLIYVFGMALTYAVLGVVAASTGALFGSLFQSPIFVISIVTIFTVLALGMFGLFELQVPSSLAVKLQGVGGSSSWIGIFLMGIVAGLVASPCVGPVLVGLLVYIAQTGSVLLGFTLLFTLGAGIGMIFLVIGTFSGLLTTMPGAGTWMDSVKQFFGFLLLGAALYFADPLIPGDVFLPGAGLILVFMAGTVLGLFDPMPEGKRVGAQIRKTISLILFIVGLALFLGPFAGRFIDLPLGSSATSHGTGEAIEWRDDFDAAWDEARAAGRPIMIDFTAEWCAACKELEHYTYTAPHVIEESRRFTSIVVDCTEATDTIKELKTRFSVYGLPTIIWVDSSGSVVEELTVTGFVEADPYVEIMRAVP